MPKEQESKQKDKYAPKHKHKKKQVVTIDDFRFIKMLGQGAQGRVFMVEKKGGIDDGKLYAMKIYERETVKDDEYTINQIKSERKILKGIVDSPFLITMKYAFQSRAYLYIVLELAQGGDLFSFLQNRPEIQLKVEELRIYIAEVLVAIEALHKQNVVYRDLKLENVLLDQNGHIIVTDFGLAFNIKDMNTELFAKFAGTPFYLGPEAADDTLPYGFDLDWWALGILAYELYKRKVPFNTFFSDDQDEAREQLKGVVIEIDESIEEPFADFIKKLLVKDPNERLGHNGSEEIKKHPFFDGIDWEKIYAKQMQPPIIPQINEKYDVSGFDTTYTREDVTFEDLSSKSYESKTFAHFDFIAPTLRLDMNLTDDAKHKTHSPLAEKSDQKSSKRDDKKNDKQVDKKHEKENYKKRRLEEKGDEKPAKRVKVDDNMESDKKRPLDEKIDEKPSKAVKIDDKKKEKSNDKKENPKKRPLDEKTDEKPAKRAKVDEKKEGDKNRHLDEKINEKPSKAVKIDEKKSEKSINKKESDKNRPLDEKIDGKLSKVVKIDEKKRVKVDDKKERIKKRLWDEEIVEKPTKRVKVDDKSRERKKSDHKDTLKDPKKPNHKDILKGLKQPVEKSNYKKDIMKGYKLQGKSSTSKSDKKSETMRVLNNMLKYIKTLPKNHEEILFIAKKMKKGKYVPNELRPSVIVKRHANE